MTDSTNPADNLDADDQDAGPASDPLEGKPSQAEGDVDDTETPGS